MSKVTPTSNEVKKTLTIVDRSTKALNTAADAVVKAAQDLQNITVASTQLTQDIEFKQSELDSLEEQLVIKQREQAAELRLRVKENADAVLAELLKERGLITTTTKDVKDVEAQLAKALADNAEEVKDWYYFIFPSANKLRSKYVRIYGTKISTRSTIERKCPDLDYIQYDSKKWTTPAKYTNRKPCDCYTEWML